MTTRTKVHTIQNGGKITIQKNATNIRQKNNEDIESSYDSTKSSNNESTKNVNRRISFKIKSSLPPRRLENRMYITTISASRVQELTSKFNQMCSKDDAIQKLPKKLSTIIKTNLNTKKEPISVVKQIENEYTKSKVKKKPSIKRKPSFARITPSKNISETIKLFEQNVPSTANKTQKSRQKLISTTVEKLKTNSNSTSQFHKPLKHIDSIKCAIQKNSNSKVKEKDDCLDGKKKIKSTQSKVKLKKETESSQNSKESSAENICIDKTVEEKNALNNVTKLSEQSNSQEESQETTQSVMLENTDRNISVLVNEDEESKSTGRESPIIITKKTIAPNTSFLWRKPAEVYDRLMLSVPESDENVDNISLVSSESYVRKYEKMLAKTDALITKFKSELYSKQNLDDNSSNHSYDNCSNNYEFVERTTVDSDSSYEEVGCGTNTEDASNLYEQIGSMRGTNFSIKPPPNVPPSVPPRGDVEILANVLKRNSLTSHNPTDKEDKTDPSNYYESIGGNTSRCNSTISHDQQSNSLYGRWEGGKAESDISYSDKSDDWVDISDSSNTNYYNDDTSTFIIIHERPAIKKVDKTWSDKVRVHNQKSSSKSIISKGDEDESDHLYESLSSNEHESDFEEIVDSFDSDTESEDGKAPIKQTPNGDKFDNCQLPPTPEANVYSLSRLANRAGKHMQKLKKNWFLTKNDLTKSLGRITRKKTQSQSDLKINPPKISDPKFESSSVFYENAIPISNHVPHSTSDFEKIESPPTRLRKSPDSGKSNSDSKIIKRNSAFASPEYSSTEKPSKKRQWSSKFKRSLSLSGDVLHSTNPNQASRHSLTPEKPQSTFYLYNIQIDKEGGGDSMDGKTNGQPISTPELSVKSNSASPIIDPNKKSSWYTDNEIYLENKIKPTKSPSACWYAEINLYPNSPQNTTPSTRTENSADSSDSFSSSTTPTLKDENESVSSYGKYCNNSINKKYVRIAEDPSENNEDAHPTFLQDEPLYQFYTAQKLESGMRILRSSWNEDDDSDGYEQVGELHQKQSRPSAMQLIRPSSPGHNRTLWCEVPQVISSNLLDILNSQQQKLQEAKFELITSEASYLLSLNVLCNHFKNTIQREHLLAEEDHVTLFGNIEPVKKCAENLLADLENCWQGNILLHGICDIIRQHAVDHFSVYITYCENQVNLEQTFRRLREQNGQFIDVLNRLESSPICQSLPLHSFLMLPMQRITRLPLLLDAILKRLTPEDNEYEPCQSALSAVSQVVKQCNEAARKVEQLTEFKRVWSKLEFPAAKPSPNFEQNRLIRSGEVTQLISRGDDVKLTFGKKFIKIPLNLFLFTNLFIVAKRKGSDDLYSVIHYCPRNFIEIQTNELVQLTTKDTAGKHLLFFTILENQEKKTIEMMLSCGTATDKQRWFEAFIPPISQNPDETLYESWDCPQVIVLHAYNPQQPDELPLDAGDVVNVTRKMTDGWYLGERMRDGRSGWFPGNHVTEVASAHIRAKNLKQRYRLLALSQNFLESQRKK